ncbi:MAG: hypothetical protein KKH94_12855 [Candidatus Omnitrophica bacterium]|nr:hypothetical protein [Candidatus Omnitrophota bacterium]
MKHCFLSWKKRGKERSLNGTSDGNGVHKIMTGYINEETHNNIYKLNKMRKRI